jgi:two-component system sensor histidine kinase MtrB
VSLRSLVARLPLARRAKRAAASAGVLVSEIRAVALAAWRRSLQLRVVVSTLALSTAVSLVLGLVLQTQIADRLLQGKFDAAIAQAESARVISERDLSGVDPDREGAQGTLNNALDQLTNQSPTDAAGAPTAGEFRAALTTGTGSGPEISAGNLDHVSPEQRQTVADGALSTQYTTVDGIPTLIVGQPVRTAGRELQLYLMFPLDAEQRTLGLVQSTLIVGGLVLILLLAGIASLVTRQVVRPVRQAAEVAERFAEGHLDERMPVHGEDEVARLFESYNEMASSIQTQIRQLEEFGALQRRFTSDVSHELRTPLTTVRMAADILYASRDELIPALRRSSELLVTELDRFETLLGDLLEISRLDAGVAELGTERLDMRHVVSRAVEAVRGLAEESATPLVLDLPGDVYAEVDSRRVERIVRNLVANAIDHGEGRPVTITLAGDDHAVAVVVRDHGVGLRPGEAGLVFNRFWRAEESRARRSGGSGLGLSISLEDARLHGGWLQAWGEPGRGSAFRLTLPRTEGDLLESSPLPLQPEGDDPDTAHPLPASVPTPPWGTPIPAELRDGEHPDDRAGEGVAPAEPAVLDPRGDR